MGQGSFPGALFLDLLESRLFNDLSADPQRLETLIPHSFAGTIILDEVQKVPAILDEVHRLIESRKISFVLTGSSARKLRREGPNLLASRALTQNMHPLTAVEMGDDFDIAKALRHGMLPSIPTEPEPALYLESYVSTYLQEEIRQDLMLAHAIAPFTKRAKRRLVNHPKFYFFDVGVFRILRPSGPLDTPETAEGPAFETLFLQNLVAVNETLRLGYDIQYWRTSNGTEARLMLIYGGDRKRQFDAIEAWPMVEMLKALPELLRQGG